MNFWDRYESVSDDDLMNWVYWFLDRQQHPHTIRLVSLTSAIRRLLKCAELIASDERIENEIVCLLEPEDDINW